MSDDNQFSSYPYKIIINEYQQQISNQQDIIDNLQHDLKTLTQENVLITQELKKVLNSRGWRLLEKTRKAIPKTKKPIKEQPNNSEEPQKKIFPPYRSNYEENIDFSKFGYKPETKAIAFYLPQFHTFKENDKWWGKGFTEWTNTKKSTPRFVNHYQPREPHKDIGYYTLDNAETIKKQVTLAKQHGIYGFCFYYYWFSGKKLMEKPMDIFLNNKDIDFPFCLCWANENWTRTWDGLNKNILIKQHYKDDDPVKFIKDLKKYLNDPRYIKVDNKPVILVYAPDSIPNFAKTVKIWRSTAQKIGIGEILIWSKSSILNHDFKNANYVDAEFDFAPTGCTFRNSFVENNDEHTILDYSKLVQDYSTRRLYYNHFPIKPFYYSCTLGWDNSPRRKNGYCVLANYSTKSFYNWLSLIIEETKRRYPQNEQFVFINAWNEWAEGAYLEPDKKYGYSNINTASKAIYGLPFDSDNKELLVLDKNSPSEQTKSKIAIQIHAFYPTIINEILKPISQFQQKIDIYITTDTATKKRQIEKILQKYNLKAKKITIVENIGRDVYPFITQMSNTYQNYDIIGHFHTKKTPQSFYGESWRQQIFHNILNSPDNLSKIFTLFNNKKLGLVMPPYYYSVKGNVEIGSNISMINQMLIKMNLHVINRSTKISFPTGTMFWARTKSIEDIFKAGLTETDFPEEAGQIDGTMAHAIERLLGIIPKQKGYEIIQIINKTD